MSDAQEILNSEEVEFLLEASAAAAGQETPTAAGTQQAATMRGDLQQMNLADIFQTIGLTKMEGILKVCNPVEQRLVYFREGIVQIIVPPRSSMRRLGQRLVQAGVLDPEQLRLALLEQRKEHKPLGDLLVSGGYVPREQIDEIVALQITEELFGLFTWEHGDFEFYKGPPQDPALNERLEECPQFEVNSLLLEVARRSDEWESILHSLRSLDEVPVPMDNDAPLDLDEVHRSVLVAVDGRHTYRELADIAVMSVFDCARAARDLMDQGLIGVSTDAHIVDLAQSHLEQGHAKMALVLSQMLCDRRDDRPIGIVRDVAGIMRSAGESAMACRLLLEAAQLQTDAQLALELAQEARALNPRDLGALSFLRTTMMAHLPIDSPDLESVTLTLLDGLLIDGDLESLFAIVDETRQLETYSPSIMVREARALAKRRERDAAIDVLLAAAAVYEQAEDKKRQLEILELAFRLDRERKDIHKTIKALRTTPQTRAAQIGAIAAVVVLLAGSGVIWFLGKLREDRLLQATTEITELLAGDDRDGAQAAVNRWLESLGECPEIDDLQQRVRFAVAAEHQRLRREAKKAATDRLQQAGQLVMAGRLDEAFAIYDELRGDSELVRDVEEASTTRLDALLRDLDEVQKNLPSMLPEPPTELTERQQIEDTLTMLRRQVPPRLREAARLLLRQRDGKGLPAAIDADRRQALSEVLGPAAELLDRGTRLMQQYEAASARNDEQRRLDPLFKAALEHERRLEFEDALIAYRRLAVADANTADLRDHFLRKVQQLEGIVGVTAAIAAATAAGDFATANREFQALRLAHPQIPFQQVVRLPVRLRSSMPGAQVLWNGERAGVTPQLASYTPGTQNLLELKLEGFEPVSVPLPLIHDGSLDVVLTLLPRRTVELPGIVDQQMTSAGSRAFAVDHDGGVLAFDTSRGALAWRVETGDTAGFLTAPILYQDSLVVVGSLDGPLRALDPATGDVVWRRDLRPIEFAPAALDGRLAVVDQSDTLILLDPRSGQPLERVDLPAALRSDLVGSRHRVMMALADGTVMAVDVKELQVAWRSQPGELGQTLQATDDGLLAQRDDGELTMVDPATGRARWTQQLRGTPAGRPSCTNGRLLVSLDERLVLLDARTGKELWTTARPPAGWLGPARLLGDQIAAPTRDGAVLVFAPDSPAPRYRLRGDRDVSLHGDRRTTAVLCAGRRAAFFVRMP
ncbi:MAG: PQQ-binding-like beta-propeller repeat protein [Planctomycetota bacterium]